jgi:hypothetical protein
LFGLGTFSPPAPINSRPSAVLDARTPTVEIEDERINGDRKIPEVGGSEA